MMNVFEGLKKGISQPRRAMLGLAAASGVFVFAQGCDTVSQAFTPSSAQMAELAGSAWTDLRQKQPATNNPKYTSRVNRVAPKIISAAGGNPAEWEVVVFASDDLNAFALPGGKIGIYTGLLDIMDNDAQIATVLGHEVAHVYFNHSGQRYGRTAATQAGLGAASAVLGSGQGSQMALGALGLGAQYGVLLPFSREHELEADRYGLRYMKKAGYNMNEALTFWQKMSAAKSGGGAPPEFASTHPSDATRINQIKQEIAVLGG